MKGMDATKYDLDKWVPIDCTCIDCFESAPDDRVLTRNETTIMPPRTR